MSYLTHRESAALDRYLTQTPEEYTHHHPHSRLAYDPDDMETYTDTDTTADTADASKMTHQQSGRLGGLATLRKYGRDYMCALARKGGEAYNRKHVAGGKAGPVRPHHD